MAEVRQRKQREFVIVESSAEVIEILKADFEAKKLFLKYALVKTEAGINEFLDDNTVMLVTDPAYEPDGEIIIYGLTDKYIEVDLEVIEKRGPGYYHCNIKHARRATSSRRDLRFKVDADTAVSTNFRVSKHSIDVSGYNIPTGIKVLLEQFQSNNSGMSDIVKVDILRADDKDFILKHVKKTGSCLFIEDVDNPDSYKPMNDDFLDLPGVLGKDLDKYTKQVIERGYKSILVVPIIYLTETETSVPFAYIELISKSTAFSIEDVLKLKEMSFKLVDRIRDANTLLIPTHQEIVDISKGGCRLKVTDDDLKKSILKSRGFIFDLVFKLQAPITIYGEIRATFSDDFGNLFVGVDFQGNSSRKDEMKRFYSVLKPMEVEYKTRLIQSLKATK